MDGDTAAWVAAAVAAGAAFIAMIAANYARRQAAAAETQANAALKQADEAEKSRLATEASVTEMRKANEFAEDKDRREQSAHERAAEVEAGKVHVECTAFGGLGVHVINRSTRSIHAVTLENVVAADHPALPWKLNPNVMGTREIVPALYPQQEQKWPVVFTSEDGGVLRIAGERYSVTIAFTDADGQRWQRVDGALPQRMVEAAPPGVRVVQAAELTENQVAVRLLELMDNRIQRGEQLDLRALPAELNLEDDLIQRCLRRLHDAGYLRAQTGDDRVLSGHELTAAGHQALATRRV